MGSRAIACVAAVVVTSGAALALAIAAISAVGVNWPAPEAVATER